MTGSDDDFLGRWSRRKRASELRKTTAPLSAHPAPEPAPNPAPVPDPTAAREIAREDTDGPHAAPLTEEELEALPLVEDLVEGSDIKAFLREGVPRALRSAALRRVWMLTPAIRDYKNPAVDYAWDWNTPGGVPGDGCALSPERAAQMLRDLVTPRAATGSADPEVVQAEMSAEAEADGAAESQTDTASGEINVADSPVTVVDQNSGAEPRAGAMQESAPKTQPSRHGGALPT